MNELNRQAGIQPPGDDAGRSAGAIAGGPVPNSDSNQVSIQTVGVNCGHPLQDHVRVVVGSTGEYQRVLRHFVDSGLARPFQ